MKALRALTPTMKVYDIQPGDLVVMNQLVILTDVFGILCGVLAGIVLAAPNELLSKWLRLATAITLVWSGYQIINIWA